MNTKNWLSSALSKADPSADIVIMENPAVRDGFDTFLLKEFWPALHNHLEKTAYPYSPKDVPKIETTVSCVLVRTLWWMLFDGSGKAICRMVLECQRDGWMLRQEFFLGLPLDTDTGLLHELLGNTRLAGNPPTMSIDKREVVDYYQITFHNGTGAGWGMYNKQHIIDMALRATDIQIRMFEASIDGISKQEEVSNFLTIAYEMYESH